MRTVWHLTGKREGGWPARSACAPKIGKLVSQPHNGKVPQHGEKWCPRPSLVRGDLFKFSLHFVYAVSPDLFFFLPEVVFILVVVCHNPIPCAFAGFWNVNTLCTLQLSWRYTQFANEWERSGSFTFNVSLSVLFVVCVCASSKLHCTFWGAFVVPSSWWSIILPSPFLGRLLVAWRPAVFDALHALNAHANAPHGGRKGTSKLFNIYTSWRISWLAWPQFASSDVNSSPFCLPKLKLIGGQH